MWGLGIALRLQLNLSTACTRGYCCLMAPILWYCAGRMFWRPKFMNTENTERLHSCHYSANISSLTCLHHATLSSPPMVAWLGDRVAKFVYLWTSDIGTFSSKMIYRVAPQWSWYSSCKPKNPCKYNNQVLIWVPQLFYKVKYQYHWTATLCHAPHKFGSLDCLPVHHLNLYRAMCIHTAER